MILLSIYFILFISILFLFFIDSKRVDYLLILGYTSTFLVVLLSLYLLSFFDINVSYYKQVFRIPYIFKLLNYKFSFGVDGISVLFVFISSVVFFMLIVSSRGSKSVLKEIIICVLIAELVSMFMLTILFYRF